MSIRSQWYRLCRVAPKLPARAGHDWTPFETESVMADFVSGVGIHLLAKTHRRSRYAIAKKLADLGALQFEGRVPKPYFYVRKGPYAGKVICMWQLQPQQTQPVHPRPEGRNF